MTFTLEVEKRGSVIVTKVYATAGLCCDAFGKAADYYYGLRQVVRLVMKDERGYLIYADDIVPL